MVARAQDSAYPRTCRILEAHGIDPKNVSVDDIRFFTYREIVRDADGNKILDGNYFKTRRRFWPLYLVFEIEEALLADRISQW